MYALVADVLSYPQFLPWCRSSSLSEENDHQVRATIELAYGTLHRSFSTRNRMEPDRRIEIRLVDGPFERMEGAWRFDPLGDQGCKVSLALEYDFSNWLLTTLIGPVFNPIANSMVDAFSARAVAIYGKR